MSGAGEEDKKPAEGGAHINLKVKGQDGNEVFFRIKRSTQLKKLMNAYCDRQSVDMNAIAFLFDGRRLRGEQTPDELEMEDGDEIDAMLHQTGCCSPIGFSFSTVLSLLPTQFRSCPLCVCEAAILELLFV
uniref:Ubiquitin-like protein SMT3 n=1 Tax=Zea mays TaxID=4577 RepID=B6T938_MAIZE|nr:ubiquitin-like protein SMT3 [Zea mays]